MNRKIIDLSKEELRKVWDKNEKLRTRVFDSMNDDIINFYLEEKLSCFNHSPKGTIQPSAFSVSYELDYSGYYNYFTIKNRIQFIEDLKDCQRDYCILPDNEYDEKLLNKLVEKQELLDDYYNNLSDKNYNRLEKWLDNHFDKLEAAVYKELRSEFDILNNENDLFEWFYECEIDNMNTDGFYIDDNYNLYEHVSYIKKYA
jgi:hypothetical protein